MEFAIENGVLHAYKGTGGDVVIPDGVTTIGEYAFCNCKNLRSVIIPEGVTVIEWHAFYGCKNLQSVTIPQGVRKIGKWAFYMCESLKNLILPESLESIGYMAFGGCARLEAVILPDKVTDVGDQLFLDCEALQTAKLPAGLTCVGERMFYACRNLQSVDIPAGVKTIGDSAFYGCVKLRSVTIPEGVTAVGDWAFFRCSNLTSIAFPDTVATIGKEQFSGCERLRSVTLPVGITVIEPQTFFGCESLDSLIIPDGVTTIGDMAFSECKNLRSVTIPNGVTAIGLYAFSGCQNLQSLTIPDSVVRLSGAFLDCSIARLTLPAMLGAQVASIFSYSDRLCIDIPDLFALHVKYRICAARCFAQDGGAPADPRYASCKKYVTANIGKIIDDVLREPALLALCCREKWIAAKYMEDYLAAAQALGDTGTVAMLLDYQNNKLTAKEKERAARKKEQQEELLLERVAARMNAEGISGLNFVLYGNLRTFYDRSALQAFIESHGGKLNASMSAKTDYLIMNGEDSEKEAQAKALWVDVITERQFNCLAGRVFEIEASGSLTLYCGMEETVVIPDGVTSIGAKAFFGYEDLKSVVIPNGVTDIGFFAFFNCENLQTVFIPATVTAITESAFMHSGALTIHAPAGSYAEAYAKNAGICFMADDDPWSK